VGQHAKDGGRHRAGGAAGAGRRRAATRHRAAARPRWGRVALAGGAIGVCVIAVVGGIRILPTAPDDAAASVAGAAAGGDRPAVTGRDAAAPRVGRPQPGRTIEPLTETTVPPPDDSGDGRRVVFSESEQRVWLIDDAEDVERSYPVSGSVYDNLFPGTYEVFSRSRHAVGIDDSGTMEYFVRFTYGTGGSAIGFHDIPVDDGELVQTRRELGTPQSHGCIRQQRADAIALWEFAPIGTTVVVTP
jgi:hypothetical protein